jgi:DNA-binding NtrC family response regulator
MSELMSYDWPGNVRELENVLERAFVTADGETIERIIFSPDVRKVRPGEPLDSVDTDVPFAVAKTAIVRRFEKAYLYEALKRNEGNVSATAKKTGVNVRTLWRKIKDYGLSSDEAWGVEKSRMEMS